MPLTSIKDIVDDSARRWGDPRENIGRLVPFGIGIVDRAMLGVPIDRGGLFAIQGNPGSRKTTFVANILINQCLSGRLPPGYQIAIDTLESGMTIERYADVITSIVATKFLMYWHWNQTNERDILRLLGMGLPQDQDMQMLVEDCGVLSGDHLVRETVIRPEFLTYGERTERQMAAINMAQAVVRNFPVFIFGVSEDPDEEVARARTTVTTDLGAAYERWVWLTEHQNVRELVIDHLQEYIFPDDPSAYELMKRVVMTVSKWQKPTRGIVWILSQIGVTSEREARSQKIAAYAEGGRKLQAESQVTWEVCYEQESPYVVRLKRPVKSRIGMHPDIAIFLEPNSGAFLGQAVEFRKLGQHGQD